MENARAASSDRRSASTGSVTHEGIVVTGRDLRRSGLVLLLLIAILPG